MDNKVDKLFEDFLDFVDMQRDKFNPEEFVVHVGLFVAKIAIDCAPNQNVALNTWNKCFEFAQTWKNEEVENAKSNG